MATAVARLSKLNTSTSNAGSYYNPAGNARHESISHEKPYRPPPRLTSSTSTPSFIMPIGSISRRSSLNAKYDRQLGALPTLTPRFRRSSGIDMRNGMEADSRNDAGVRARSNEVLELLGLEVEEEVDMPRFRPGRAETSGRRLTLSALQKSKQVVKPPMQEPEWLEDVLFGRSVNPAGQSKPPQSHRETYSRNGDGESYRGPPKNQTTKDPEIIQAAADLLLQAVIRLQAQQISIQPPTIFSDIAQGMQSTPQSQQALRLNSLSTDTGSAHTVPCERGSQGVESGTSRFPVRGILKNPIRSHEPPTSEHRVRFGNGQQDLIHGDRQNSPLTPTPAHRSHQSRPSSSHLLYPPVDRSMAVNAGRPANPADHPLGTQRRIPTPLARAHEAIIAAIPQLGKEPTRKVSRKRKGRDLVRALEAQAEEMAGYELGYESDELNLRSSTHSEGPWNSAYPVSTEYSPYMSLTHSASRSATNDLQINDASSQSHRSYSSYRSDDEDDETGSYSTDETYRPSPELKVAPISHHIPIAYMSSKSSTKHKRSMSTNMTKINKRLKCLPSSKKSLDNYEPIYCETNEPIDSFSEASQASEYQERMGRLTTIQEEDEEDELLEDQLERETRQADAVRLMAQQREQALSNGTPFFDRAGGGELGFRVWRDDY
ncbi:hypothetical protein BCR39DRAFT_558104 [Naematelia encephala]|uniref:Uncharacterized protein n=1 Tax=Naematelia encephala TaxID=71784 RepID=A0A1Y2B9X4_9TREE|nr:hypothetical protein BCR39DRAFT_558104 [Naematelia encephala]